MLPQILTRLGLIAIFKDYLERYDAQQLFTIMGCRSVPKTKVVIFLPMQDRNDTDVQCNMVPSLAAMALHQNAAQHKTSNYQHLLQQAL